MKLSILIPAFNVSEFIMRCLSSVASQINPENTEIIVLNDGSTDDTEALLRTFAAPGFRYLTTPNRGEAEARNRLLEECKGDYFWFVDADDFINTKIIDQILILITESAADIIYLSYRSVFDKKNGNNHVFFDDFDSGLQLIRNRLFCNTIWQKVIRKELVSKNNLKFHQLKTGTDFVFSFQLLSLAQRIRTVSEISYYYCYNTNSISNQGGKEHLERLAEDTLKGLDLILEFKKSFSEDENRILDVWVNYFLSGFIFSLIRYRDYSLIQLFYYIAELRKRGLYPLQSSGQNIKIKGFIHLSNTTLGAQLMKNIFSKDYRSWIKQN
ncbi:MAG: glycosyltransferase family 2 protein [Bacteroidales bacterium]